MTAKQVAVGDAVFIGEEATIFTTREGEAVEVPVGTVLRFIQGFLIRQYGPDGQGNYGCPQSNFWTVTVETRDERLGLLLPEGDEVSTYHAEGETGKPQERHNVLHRKATFIPLSRIRFASTAEVMSLPAEGSVC